MINLHHIDQAHQVIDERLRNWAKWVRVSGSTGFIQPMFKQGKTSRQWDVDPVVPIAVDVLDGQAMEHAVRALPANHRSAIRWWYVSSWRPEYKVRREIGCTHDGLALLVHEGRGMLLNRIKGE